MEVSSDDRGITIEREKYEQLRKDYLDAERVSQSEREVLAKIINTFSPLLSIRDAFSEEINSIKKFINEEGTLPLDLIESEIDNLKKKIYTEELKATDSEIQKSDIDQQEEYRSKTQNLVRRVQVALTDSFYPMANALKTRSDTLKTYCNGKVTADQLDNITNAFLNFINALKLSISDDFRYVNQTFQVLSQHVKELESTLLSELGDEARKKELEQFEVKINNEMGSIVNAFSIHSTIDQIKDSVIGQISKIKKIISQRKKEELKKSKNVQEHIAKLKKRMARAEKNAMDMTRKAQHFEIVASKDKLTNLYNRHAFDNRLNEAIKGVDAGEKSFALAILDVDNFKWINDTFGHVSGDKVLKRVADCLTESFRKNDFIARYGGDEFAVIIKEMSEELVQNRVALFNTIFQKKRFRAEEIGEVNVTLSVGIAIAKKGENQEALIHRADKNMYASKKKITNHPNLK